MASLGRVPNAENDDGNDCALPTFDRRPEIRSGRRDGEIAAVHGHSLRSRREGWGRWLRFSGERHEASARTASQLTPTIGRIIAAGLIAGATHACAPALGDFDRPQPSTVNDQILPFAGKLAARHRGEPTSFYRYTDHERELRNRSWSLLMPNLPQQYFERWIAEMRRTRLMSPEKTVPDRADYVEHLLSKNYDSSGSRYLKLMSDVDANRYQIREFISVANRVAVDDRVRERALERALNVTEEERQEAIGRIWENRLLVWLVQETVRDKAAMYRYALERLLIATPDAQAALAESALVALEGDLGLLVAVRPERFAVGPVYGK
jgi:hypothetical protein